MPPDDGSRIGGEPEDPADTWLLDCQNPLAREYYRVFQRPSGTAMDPADALTVAHYHHEQLEFKCGVIPEPFIEDVLDACALGTIDDAPEFATLCADARASVTAPAHDASTAHPSYGAQSGCDLAYHLNQLYGIDAPRVALPVAPELCTLPADTTACASTEARYFYNPTTAGCESRPYGACGTDTRDFATRDECTRACINRAQYCSHCDPTGVGCSQGDDCSVCPLTLPDLGSACSDVWLECSYGPGCGGSVCTCTIGDGGAAYWDCSMTAC